jgi:hypothetical protein
MQNARKRFGMLESTKRPKDTTTRVRVHVDRAVLEPTKNEQSQAGTHLISQLWSVCLVSRPSFPECGQPQDSNISIQRSKVSSCCSSGPIR